MAITLSAGMRKQKNEPTLAAVTGGFLTDFLGAALALVVVLDLVLLDLAGAGLGFG